MSRDVLSNARGRQIGATGDRPDAAADRPLGAGRSGCVLVYRDSPTLAFSVADPENWPDEARAELIAVATHKTSMSRRVHELESIRQRYGLPGVALCATEEIDATLPQPLTIPFEPLPLYESNRVLAMMAEQGDPAIQHPSVRWLLPTDITPQPIRGGAHDRFARNALAVIVVGPALLILLVGLAVVPWVLWQLGNLPAAFDADHWLMLGAMVIPVFWLARQALRPHGSGDWWLVPGGLVLRSAGVFSSRHRLQRFTPADTILVVGTFREQCEMALHRERCIARRRIDETEYLAVLAAWQSPLVPPTMDQLSDLA